MVILAHGALGYWDELIFLAVIVLFIVFMIFSWVQSRSAESEYQQGEMQPETVTESVPDGERFELD